MKKRTYRKIAVKEVDVAALAAEVGSGRVVFAIDVAKVDMVAAVVADDGRVVRTVSWKNPGENGAVLELLSGLRRSGLAVEAVMESSGTYGDVLRHQLLEHGVPVFRVSGKRTHDAAEVYDGVPSLHDAKSAAIIAKLHRDGVSTPWGPLSEEKRELKAAIATMDLYREQHQRLIHSLESSLARHWPELTEHLELSSATLVALLARMGGPREVAQASEEARLLMRGMSHGLMSEETIEAVLQSAPSSAGVRLLGQERAALMTLAAEAHRALKEFKKARGAVERLSTSGAAQRLAPTTGKATAAVLIADVGDPLDYPSTRAYLKAYGLNLKEKSSGKQKGQLSITKRGPGRARQYLWLAVFRWLRKDAVARAWYAEKIKRDGGRRARAVIALMRKFAQALFHVGRGLPFDSSKLFDVSRLRLT
jgi:transposase